MKILILGPYGRNKKIIEFLESQNNSVIRRTGEITLDFLKEKNIDFIISSGYAPIVKEPIISAYKSRIINLHNSHLPYGRGIFPNFWSFFEGTQKGVTIHFMNEGIDTGEIIFQKEVSFSNDHTLKTSHDKLMIELEQLFFEKWNDLIKGNYELIDQKHLNSKARYHSRLESERFMDLLPEKWDTPVVEVEEMGAEFSFSGQFWEKYDSEIQELNSS